MAWTTSACLRARPFALDLAGAWMKTVRFQLALLRRSLLRSHYYALALPLAVLGFLTPLMPQSLTAALLLSSGALAALLGARAVHAQRAAAASRPGPASAAPRSLRPDAFKLSEITFEGIGPRPPVAARALVRRGRPSPDRDRDWAELMARVSHDLRTPLNAVIGFSELMVLELFGPLGDERYQDYVHHIRDSATDLLKSAEDTLALTALAADPDRRGRSSACDLDHSAADAWAFVCRRAAARAITMETSIPAGLEVLGETRILRQILVNMLSEAVARAAHGEHVMLTAAIEGELVELGVSVSKERMGPSHRNGSLAICLARTLLEMQGTSLLEVVSSSHGWRAVTVLDRAVQPDFFSDRHGTGAQPAFAL
jgi:signal transduction histidine kinase